MIAHAWGVQQERFQMAGIEHIRVDADEAGMRLDRWFKVRYPALVSGRCRSFCVQVKSVWMVAG